MTHSPTTLSPTTPARRFVTLDVFTGTPLAGNPLAVVLDAEGLDDGRMQAIAREFNLSETVFVLPPREARHRARLRIFTPERQLPFAGHPTVGTAVLLALTDQEGEPGTRVFGVEEEIGDIACVAQIEGERGGRARFRLPRLPEFLQDGPSALEAAMALSLDPTEIGFERHVPSLHSAGVPFVFVPVRDREALARVVPQYEAMTPMVAAPGDGAAFVYCADPEGSNHHFRTRMFRRAGGIREDPATGSAVAALAGALMQFEPMGEGEHDFVIEQGFEMGRPSLIELQLVIRSGALASVEIGGAAVVVCEGTMLA